jgi:hypothetical protein
MLKKKYNILLNKNEKHPFHLVESSPWPFFVSWAILGSVLLFVSHLKNVNAGIFKIFIPILLVYGVYQWFSDVIKESRNHHTRKVRAGLKLGMKLFIVSEILFFFYFFLAFFDS